MADKPLSFADWTRIQNTSFPANLPTPTTAEWRGIYDDYVRAWSADKADYSAPQSGGPEQKNQEANAKAIGQFKNYVATPAPDNVPGAQDRSPAKNAKIAKASETKRAADAEGTPEQKLTASQRYLQSFLGGGANNWYPWMAAADVSGNTDIFGADQSAPALSDNDISRWRNEWNVENPTKQYGDNESFMASTGAIQGRPEYRSAFQKGLNLGDNQTRSYEYRLNSPVAKSTTVDINAAAADAAGSSVKGGTPALDRYMNIIAGVAKLQNIPWQLLWGVLRARLATGSQATGVGLFNLDQGVLPTGMNDPAAQINYLARQLKQGFDQTGDWSLAAVYTDDPQSAMMLRKSGHSTPGREARDGQYVMDVFGLDSTTKQLSLYDLGFGQNGENAHTHVDPIVSQAGGAGGKAGPTVNVPDINLLRQQADSMIRQLLFRAPTEEEVDAMANSMRDAVVQSQMQASQQTGNPYAAIYDGAPADAANATIAPQVDTQADMYAQLQASPDYQELYANRGGLTEQDYAQQFQNVESDLLGSPNADNAALREGLAGGDTDAFRSYLYGSSNDNRTFRQRLYQTAQALANV